METSSTLQFKPNVPVEVALEYASGKRCANARVMYTLTDGQKMFLDAPVADRVDALRVRPGEAISICKVGKGKDCQWAVGRVGDVRAEALPAARRPAAAPLAFAPKPAETPQDVRSRQMVASADNSMRCYLKAAVSAMADTEKYAASISREVKFSSSDILTAAIFLAQMRGGGS